ncbi:MAG: hypothetical protein OSA97_06005 [Nevskia sp.]|nr:hypothetical protein [Nevskia sp.]
MRGFVRSFKAFPALTLGAVVVGVLEFAALQRSQLSNRALPRQ